MSTTAEYSPDDISVVVHDLTIQGFAKGTFVKVSRDTESFKDDVGAKGDVVVTRTKDRRGSIEITLMNSSQSNADLSNILINAERFGLVAKPSQVQNSAGADIHHASKSWVQKPADQQFSDEPDTTTWIIRCADLDMFVGGATPL